MKYSRIIFSLIFLFLFLFFLIYKNINKIELFIIGGPDSNEGLRYMDIGIDLNRIGAPPAVLRQLPSIEDIVHDPSNQKEKQRLEIAKTKGLDVSPRPKDWMPFSNIVAGQSLRNANRQLRIEPPNPQVSDSPWLKSVDEKKLFEIKKKEVLEMFKDVQDQDYSHASLFKGPKFPVPDFVDDQLPIMLGLSSNEDKVNDLSNQNKKQDLKKEYQNKLKAYKKYWKSVSNEHTDILNNRVKTDINYNLYRTKKIIPSSINIENPYLPSNTISIDNIIKTINKTNYSNLTTSHQALYLQPKILSELYHSMIMDKTRDLGLNNPFINNSLDPQLKSVKDDFRILVKSKTGLDIDVTPLPISERITNLFYKFTYDLTDDFLSKSELRASFVEKNPYYLDFFIYADGVQIIDDDPFKITKQEYIKYIINKNPSTISKREYIKLLTIASIKDLDYLKYNKDMIRKLKISLRKYNEILKIGEIALECRVNLAPPSCVSKIINWRFLQKLLKIYPLYIHRINSADIPTGKIGVYKDFLLTAFSNSCIMNTLPDSCLIGNLSDREITDITSNNTPDSMDVRRIIWRNMDDWTNLEKYDLTMNTPTDKNMTGGIVVRKKLLEKNPKLMKIWDPSFTKLDNPKLYVKEILGQINGGPKIKIEILKNCPSYLQTDPDLIKLANLPRSC